MIKARNIVKVYPNGVKALDGISFEIGEGEVCGYLGANGAGKSTTIKILAAMMSPTSGTVEIDGLNTAEHSHKIKSITGYVPESGELFLSLTPYDFLQFVCKMFGIDKNTYNGRINNFMELFDLKNELHTPMYALSKGMRQKVLIISSLIHDPEIILWDEPLGGVDYSTAVVVRNLVKELSAKGKIIFYSTHIIESVDKICSRVIVLNAGKIVFDGSLNGSAGTNTEEIMKKYMGAENMSGKIKGLYDGMS